MSNDLYWYYQTHSCTTAAPSFFLSQLCVGNPCQYNAAASNMSLRHSFLLTEKSVGWHSWFPLQLWQTASCTRSCLAHWCASYAPASRTWVLSPVILQLPTHLISLPITSNLKLGSLEEASISNLKGEFPGLLRVSCLLKRKKPSKSSPSHCPDKVCPGIWLFWQRLLTVKDL